MISHSDNNQPQFDPTLATVGQRQVEYPPQLLEQPAHPSLVESVGSLAVASALSVAH